MNEKSTPEQTEKILTIILEGMKYALENQDYATFGELHKQYLKITAEALIWV